MVSESERQRQQRRAAEFKARKKLEGKFGGVTGRERGRVGSALQSLQQRVDALVAQRESEGKPISRSAARLIISRTAQAEAEATRIQRRVTLGTVDEGTKREFERKFGLSVGEFALFVKPKIKEQARKQEELKRREEERRIQFEEERVPRGVVRAAEDEPTFVQKARFRLQKEEGGPELLRAISVLPFAKTEFEKRAAEKRRLGIEPTISERRLEAAAIGFKELAITRAIFSRAGRAAFTPFAKKVPKVAKTAAVVGFGAETTRIGREIADPTTRLKGFAELGGLGTGVVTGAPRETKALALLIAKRVPKLTFPSKKAPGTVFDVPKQTKPLLVRISVKEKPPLEVQRKFGEFFRLVETGRPSLTPFERRIALAQLKARARARPEEFIDPLRRLALRRAKEKGIVGRREPFAEVEKIKFLERKRFEKQPLSIRRFKERKVVGPSIEAQKRLGEFFRLVETGRPKFTKVEQDFLIGQARRLIKQRQLETPKIQRLALRRAKEKGIVGRREPFAEVEKIKFLERKRFEKQPLSIRRFKERRVIAKPFAEAERRLGDLFKRREDFIRSRQQAISRARKLSRITAEQVRGEELKRVSKFFERMDGRLPVKIGEIKLIKVPGEKLKVSKEKPKPATKEFGQFLVRREAELEKLAKQRDAKVIKVGRQQQIVIQQKKLKKVLRQRQLQRQQFVETVFEQVQKPVAITQFGRLQRRAFIPQLIQKQLIQKQFQRIAPVQMMATSQQIAQQIGFKAATTFKEIHFFANKFALAFDFGKAFQFARVSAFDVPREVARPIVPPPTKIGFPEFDFPEPRRKKEKIKDIPRLIRPSAVAIAFGIRGPLPKGPLTGAELRPLPPLRTPRRRRRRRKK